MILIINVLSFFPEKLSMMFPSNHSDNDGYKLHFEENCPQSDKEYFMKKYPKIEEVSSKRLHCTTCDIHIGTAPMAEKIIRTHQVLHVTQCNKCYAFYNSGEFGKGEDGSEYYCRWCGQGGEVFCCSTCPYVFCNKCIRSNLSNSYVKEIEENDDWSCFVCNKSILVNHRAQHWALRNYMIKQLEVIKKTEVRSEGELDNLLNEDFSSCCPKKKRKTFIKIPVAPVKRPLNGGFTQQPPQKKMSMQPSIKSYQVRTSLPEKIVNSRPQAKSNNSEIVCTPDIIGLFSDTEDITLPPSNAVPSTSPAPPPLVLRNNQRVLRQALSPSTSSPVPIYHNVNGYQIDLNHAARQEIFRLPNGKLIQVRKQPSTPPVGNVRSSQPRGPPQFTIRQALPQVPSYGAPRPVAPSARNRQPAQPQQRFTFSDGRVLATPIVPPPSTLPAAAQPAATPAQSSGGSTVFTQQNGSISVARAQHPNTPFGKAKVEFEDKIINGLEICQHTINKMITLTNNTSFKTSRTFTDLKGLYIHLQYLFTYTSGKLKSLQENLANEISPEQSISEAIVPPSIPIEPPMIQIPLDNEDISDASNLIENDPKLGKIIKVKVEKLEDTKNPIIKQYMEKIKQRLEEVSFLHELTPDALMEVDVELDLTEQNVDEPENNSEEKEESDKDESKAEEASEAHLSDDNGNDVDVTSNDENKSSDKESLASLGKEFGDDKEASNTSFTSMPTESEILKIDNVPPTDLMELDDDDDIENKTPVDDTKIVSSNEYETMSKENHETVDISSDDNFNDFFEKPSEASKEDQIIKNNDIEANENSILGENTSLSPSDLNVHDSKSDDDLDDLNLVLQEQLKEVDGESLLESFSKPLQDGTENSLINEDDFINSLEENF
ncbi:CLUMA_CG001560, isoform A [Clunio marinus]|uniref:CLUMA_CG001560, isoform A n=1 Tax=Clunio marinus TaxID=568069 RepID=A0A1J1HNI1_9DIPT|nr:CLUMA_CG001560, isoform A [Clunio marinus]